MLLAEYNRRFHPAPARMSRPMPEPLLAIEVPTVRIPVKTITIIKATVFAGLVVGALVPPQWAWLALIPNAYWMFKL